MILAALALCCVILLTVSLSFLLAPPAIEGIEPVTSSFGGLWWVWLLMAAVLVAALAWLICKNKNAPIAVAVKEGLGRLSAPHYFLLFAGALLVLSLIYVTVNRANVWEYLIFRGGDDLFMDFFNHVGYVSHESGVYQSSVHACFPAFAYLFYALIAWLLPEGAAVMHAPHLMSPLLYVAYFIVTAISVALLSAIVNRYLKAYSPVIRGAVVLMLLCSNVFIDMIERGNSVFLAVILLLAAMLLREREGRLPRELALIFIAAAAGLKVYPALFGALYLLERRYAEAVRLVVYGVAFFLLPFAFFGGVDGFLAFFANQSAVQGEIYISLSSIKAAVQCIAVQATGDPLSLSWLATGLQILFLILSAVAFLDKRLAPWERSFLLVAVMAFFPAWSGEYTSVYFLLPLLLLLRELASGFGSGALRWWRVAALVVLGFTFSFVALILPNGAEVYTFRFIALYALDVALIVKAIRSLVLSLKRKKMA